MQSKCPICHVQSIQSRAYKTGIFFSTLFNLFYLFLGQTLWRSGITPPGCLLRNSSWQALETRWGCWGLNPDKSQVGHHSSPNHAFKILKKYTLWGFHLGFLFLLGGDPSVSAQVLSQLHSLLGVTSGPCSS